MNAAQLTNQISRCRQLLAQMKLIQRFLPTPDYLNAGDARKLTYFRQWQFYLEKNMYHFLLNDWSLLQFEASWNGHEPKFRFAYFECPQLPEKTIQDFESYENTFIRNELEEVFESYLIDEAMTKEHVTPIRYDFTPEQYKEGCHPASHLHLGYENEIRLSTKRILRPVSFILLIIRQCYPAQWKQLLDRDDFSNWIPQVQQKLKKVDDLYFGTKDFLELHLE